MSFIFKSLKLLKTNAAIWFNKICRDRQLKPKYISFKINGRKQQDKESTCLPARETTYTNARYAATTILIRKVHILTRDFS